MKFDQLQTDAILDVDGGDYDVELQETCLDAGFEERLAPPVSLD
jgi:hypothetical protein